MAPMGAAGIVPGAPIGEGATNPVEGAAPIPAEGIPGLGIVAGWVIGTAEAAGILAGMVPAGAAMGIDSDGGLGGRAGALGEGSLGAGMT